MSVIIRVPIVNDDIPEQSNEDFVINLSLDSGPDDLTMGNSENTVTIVDDDGMYVCTYNMFLCKN